MKLSKFLQEAVAKVDLTFKKMDEVKAAYVKTCDLFMLGKDDVKRSKTEELFKFFNEFFDAVDRALPKAEKKKPSAAAGKLKKAGGLVINAAELANA